MTFITTMVCDLCSLPIEHPDTQAIIVKPGQNKIHQTIDSVLTPRGNRIHLENAMMRMNFSIYIGFNPSKKEEFHLHDSCIEREAYERLLDIAKTSVYDPHKSKAPLENNNI